ncbi:MAG: signal recognition particle-docking protein FtsY [Acidimicrobiia bacterium]|nr:signal recognition particle-docking protein FtsY [Acidimicrobiia bacterium]
METMQLLIAIALLGVVIGVTFALVRGRNRTSGVPMEPPPDAPRIPPGVREEAEARAKAIREAPLPDEVPSVEDVIEEARREMAAGGGAGASTDDAPPVEPPSSDAPLEAPLEDTSTEGVDAAAAAAATAEVSTDEEVEAEAEPAPVPLAEKPRFRDRLGKARAKLADVFGGLRGSGIDDETWEDLEYALIGADVGVEPTEELLAAVRQRVADEGVTDGDGVLDVLKDEMKQRLSGHDRELHLADEAPSVWLFVGVNGVGKTTTIGKLAKREVDDGRSVVMAAGDTFRAAAVEQLSQWADRSGADIVRGSDGGDPSAVIFDAVEAAAARHADLVMADTAGRLHTKSNLMEELRKVRRVAEKGAGTVSEALLVLDATTGQNGLVQAEQFGEAVALTGVVLTKLDGSAKGGIVFAIQDKLGIPVKLVGLGEGVEDLVAFDVDEFVDALFA